MKQVVDKLTLFIVLCLAVGSFQAAAQSTYTLTANGIGPVQIGVKAIELPESVPNLYDSKVSDVYIDEEMPDDEDMPEFATWYFYDEEGETVFIATQDSLGYICEISVNDPKILTPEGIHVGTPQQQLDKIKGALKIQPDPWADNPQNSYELNGITIWIDGYSIDDEHSEYRVSSMTVPADDSYDLLYEKTNRVITQVLPHYINSTSLRQMASHLDEISNIDGVEHTYSNGSTTIFVEIENGGTISFSFYPDDNTISGRSINDILEKLKSITDTDYSHSKVLNQFCIAFQMGNDAKFNDSKKLMQSAKKMFNKCGMNGPEEILKPTVDFFLNDMYNYDYVLLDTHGFYRAEVKSTVIDNNTGNITTKTYPEHHFLATSEIASNLSESDIKGINDQELSRNERLEEILIPDIYKKYMNLWRGGFLAYGFLNEDHGSGDIPVCYVTITDDLISENKEGTFSHFGNAIVFCSACESLKGPKESGGISYQLAKAFMIKGAGAYLGYTDEIFVGGEAGYSFFGRLLSGMSINQSYYSLDEHLKKDRNAILKLVFPDMFYSNIEQNIGNHYRIFPKAVDPDNHFNMESVFNKDFKAQLSYYIPNQEGKFVEQVVDLGEGKYNGLISNTIMAKVPLHYTTRDAQNLIRENAGVESIPLLYGFQFCRNKDFKDKVLTLIAPIGKSAVITNLIDNSIICELSSTYNGAERKVEWEIQYSFPKSWIWNDEKEAFYYRPIIFDGTKVANFGGISTNYKTGGPSDPNRGSNKP